MSARGLRRKPKVPATVADLDLIAVSDALARHSYNVTDAAHDLGVPAFDLRRLLWANPQLQDQSFEIVESRIDLAEKNIAELLRSSDGRERLAASIFTIRNSVRARRRGWITAAAAVDLNVNSNEPPRNIVITWGDPNFPSPEMETIWRDGKEIQVPRYGVTRSNDRSGDDALEGEVATPAVLLERASAIVPGPELAAPSQVESAPAPDPAIRRKRDQIDAWIRNRLIDYPLTSCFGCRKPIVAGAAWEEVSNGDTNARARFHRACHAEWRTGQEAAARQALGLAG